MIQFRYLKDAKTYLNRMHEHQLVDIASAVDVTWYLQTKRNNMSHDKFIDMLARKLANKEIK